MVNRLKLNEKTVRDAENLGRDYQIFDTEVRGFSITIYPSGNRSFTLDYRVAGRQRRMTAAKLVRTIGQVTATSASWKVLARAWRTTRAPILMSFSWKSVSDQSAIASGNLMQRRKVARF